ncbi:MAG TPA: sigma-54 dependent transcriptional regulator [Gemmatimonas sp.]|uniref:sigma-54 dependent transcriptional regulator n=1 Tax=Gemmatimonas sp. TaxID=1962908 RepID=UPI002EDB8E8D
MLEINVGASRPWHQRMPGEDGPGAVQSSRLSVAAAERRAVVRVLVVTPCEEAREALRAGLEAIHREVLHAENPGGLGRMIEPAKIDLVICDQRLVTDDGVEMLRAIRGSKSSLPIAWFDAPPHRNDHLPALPHGPIGRLKLPVDTGDLRRLMQAVEEPEQPARTMGAPMVFHGMLAGAASMEEVFRKIRRVGPTDASVLITGESGTGKELVAQALHQESPRRDRPFIALNCSALPSELIESELFGHTRGAFTGAMRDRAGLFEAADGGTLFLDEIGDLGPLAQAKVLRALENREVMRVGGTKTTSVDVRIIAATHRDLPQMVSLGEFREDLLYRLQVIGLTLPALRERSSDIGLLTEHFVRHFAERHGLVPRMPDRTAHAALAAYAWPGNIRELRNCIEGALILCDGDAITLNDLPSSLIDAAPHSGSTTSAHLPHRQVSGVELREDLTFVEARELALDEFDRSYLATALSQHDGNIAQTARAIGLHRQSLQKLLTRRHMRAGPSSN